MKLQNELMINYEGYINRHTKLARITLAWEAFYLLEYNKENKTKTRKEKNQEKKELLKDLLHSLAMSKQELEAIEKVCNLL